MINSKAEQIMNERFGKDSIISLATIQDNIPYVRNVDAYYEKGCFYIVTYSLSKKIKQINVNPKVAVAGEWFTGQGEGTNLGPFQLSSNKEIADKLSKAFAGWLDNGHTDITSEHTVILCIKLYTGILFANGERFDIDFQ